MLPKFVIEILCKKFTSTEVELIAKNWYKYSQISLTNSCEFEFVLQGKSILSCVA